MDCRNQIISTAGTKNLCFYQCLRNFLLARTDKPNVLMQQGFHLNGRAGYRIVW